MDKGMLIVILFFAFVGVVAFLQSRFGNQNKGGVPGNHITDFKISTVISGYITESLHLCVKEGFSFSYKMRVVDLNSAAYVGGLAQGGSRSVKADFVKFYDKDNKQVGSTITLANINEVNTFFQIIQQYAPHIEIGDVRRI